MAEKRGKRIPTRGVRDGRAGEHKEAEPRQDGPDPPSGQQQAGRWMVPPAVFGMAGGLALFALEIAQRNLEMTPPSRLPPGLVGAVLGVVTWGLQRIDKILDHRHGDEVREAAHRRRMEAKDAAHRRKMEIKAAAHRQRLEERRLEARLQHDREQDLRKTCEAKERATRQTLKEGSSHLESGHGLSIERDADGTSRTSIQPPRI
jgi:hypothetical protein